MRSTSTRLTCAHCGEPVRPEFRFCPWCGRKFGRIGTPAPPDAAHTVSEDVVIQFALSDHPSLQPLLAAARKRAGYSERVQVQETVCRVPFAETELLALAEFGALADRLPEKRVYYRADEVPWNNVFGYLRCYLQRQMHENPESHCFGEEPEGTFNLWGCARVGLPFNIEGEWCRWGSFEEGTTRYRFDRARLQSELRRRLAKVRFCPALTRGFAESVLDVFPETVDPHRDKDWSFVQAAPGEPGMPVVVRTGFSGKERINVLGVGPRSRGAAREILGKARRRRPARRTQSS